MTPLIIATKTPPTSAPSALTATSGVSRAANANSAAFITNANNPNVKQVIGSVRNDNTGFTNAVRHPRMMPKITTACSPSYVTRSALKMVPTASTETMLPMLYARTRVTIDQKFPNRGADANDGQVYGSRSRENLAGASARCYADLRPDRPSTIA